MKKRKLTDPKARAVDTALVAKALGAERIFTLTKGERSTLSTGRIPSRVAQQLTRSRTGVR